MESTIAVVNMEVTNEKKTNLAKILGFVDEAASRRADLLVLPEACLQGYVDTDFPIGSGDQIAQRRYFLEEAEPLDGPSIRALEEAAARSGVALQVGFVEADPSGEILYNSVALTAPDGLRGAYRKTHNQFEYPYFAPGDAIGTTQIGDRLYGSLICYDIAFPEVARASALQGATVILMSTAWPMRGHDRDTDYYGACLTLCARSAAFANQLWLAMSNHCEHGAYRAGLDYYGGAQVIDPCGEVVAALGADEGMTTWTADFEDSVRRARTESFFSKSLLQDRRPDLYGPLAAGSSGWRAAGGTPVGAHPASVPSGLRAP